MFGKLFSAVVKTVLTPVAIVKDGIDIVTEGETNNTTEKHINSIIEDIDDAMDL